MTTATHPITVFIQFDGRTTSRQDFRTVREATRTAKAWHASLTRTYRGAITRNVDSLIGSAHLQIGAHDVWVRVVGY